MEMGTGFIKPLVQRMDALFAQQRRFQDLDFAAGTATAASAGPPRLISEEEARAKNRRPPSHFFRHDFNFTIETEEPELAEAVEFLETERFLFATDYPHDDRGGRVKERDIELLQANERLAEVDKEPIRSGNAIALFRLKSAAPSRASGVALGGSGRAAASTPGRLVDVV